MTTAATSAPATSPPASVATPLDVDLERPVFVCGVGRSGTSLLQSMLNAHPDLALPPETHFFRRYVAPRRTRRRIERGTVARFAARLAADDSFARAEIAVDDALTLERDGALDVLRVHGRLLAGWAHRAGKRRVGDKDPRNLELLPELRAAYPGARVVHIVRDPRAVVASRMGAEWSAGRPRWSHALVAEEQLRRGRAAARRVFGDACLELRYEDLVRDPREALRRVAAHVEVDYSDAMLEFGASARQLVAPSEVSWKKETFGPLLPESVNRWEQSLEPADVAHVEAVCREGFDGLGYERTTASGAGRALLGQGARALARCAFTARHLMETTR